MRRLAKHGMLPLAVMLLCQAATALAEEAGMSYAEDSSSSETVCEDCICTEMQPPCRIWTIDYRIRSMINSHTSYEFGTYPGFPPVYAPLSRLDWSLDSVWSGLRIGLEKPKWDVHFEWMAPVQQNINGSVADYDWLTPSNPSRLGNLSYSQERWNEGQMLDLGGEFKLTERFFTLPVQVWPTAGFRFQRFDMTAHDTWNVIPTAYPIPGVVGTFNQQYYLGYIGGQLRTTLDIPRIRRPINLTFQGDWGATWGYNVDHHISGYEPQIHRFTTESTSGGATHLALIAETPLTCRFSLGLQAEYLGIYTTGEHHFVVSGAQSADLRWSNGVVVKSDQTSLTAFLRASY